MSEPTVKKEEEQKEALPPPGDRPVTLKELPKSTLHYKRVSLSEMALKDPDIFTEKRVIGQGTFGYPLHV